MKYNYFWNYGGVNEIQLLLTLFYNLFCIYQIRTHLKISLSTFDRYFKIMVHCEKYHHP